jgi:tetratricopeptide (TPR) repeat protein
MDRPYLELAYRYAVAGRPRDARALLESRERELRALGPGGVAMLRRDRYEIEPLIVEGRLSGAEGRVDDALAALRLAEARRERLTALPELGAVLDQAGQHDSAIAVYERYLTRGWLGRHLMDGWHRARVVYRLGELYEARGDRERAIQRYGELVELWRTADPELQPAVQKARNRLAALRTETAAAKLGRPLGPS